MAGHIRPVQAGRNDNKDRQANRSRYTVKGMKKTRDTLTELWLDRRAKRRTLNLFCHAEQGGDEEVSATMGHRLLADARLQQGHADHGVGTVHLS